MPVRKMTLAKTNDKEIAQVRDLLNELEALNKYYSHKFVIEAVKDNKEDFELLSTFNLEDSETFLDDLCRYVNNIRHGCVIFNLHTLLDNCADPNLDHLDFNPELKRGLELVELEKEGKLKIL